MGGDVAVSLLVTIVFRDIVQIISSDHDGSLHLGADHNALENLAADVDSTGEGTLLIDIVALNGLLGSLEVESDIFVVPDTGVGLLCHQFFAVQEDVVLLLESPLLLSGRKSTWISAMKIVENIKYLI
jgi:hypothetical protein